MRRKFERVYPYLIPLLCAVAFWRWGCQFPTGQDILSASITMGAIFVGFLATAKSIIISLQSPKVDQLKKTQFFGLLLDYLQEAIVISLVYCVFSLLGFFLDSAHPPLWYGPLWVFFTLSTVLTFQRISHILLSLIRTI